MTESRPVCSMSSDEIKYSPSKDGQCAQTLLLQLRIRLLPREWERNAVATDEHNLVAGFDNDLIREQSIAPGAKFFDLI